MGEPVDPVDRICHYARGLYVKNLVERKLTQFANRLERMDNDAVRLLAAFIDFLVDDIAFEAADIYSIRCKEKVRSVLEEAGNRG